MSRVFVADELRLGRKVVVKVLSPELAAGISAERFEREIRLAASLQQANIVPVLSAGETDGLPFYTMPYVEGESLRVRLGGADAAHDGRDPSHPRRHRTRAAVRAQPRHRPSRHQAGQRAALGRHGGRHRFRNRESVVGVAHASCGTSITQLGTSIGTPAYMAPEQAAGDPDVDGRADIYALGCLAYELLTRTRRRSTDARRSACSRRTWRKRRNRSASCGRISRRRWSSW